MDPKTFTDVDFKFVDGQPDNQLLKGLKVWPVTEVSSASLIFALPCLALPCLALPCLALPCLVSLSRGSDSSYVHPYVLCLPIIIVFFPNHIQIEKT